MATGAQDLPFSCDLVMKGGFTSGVVYPTAIAELAEDHRLHNIGGSSAGAIAAVGAAAAEYGRQTGGGGFDEFRTIPGKLAEEHDGRTQLQRLFVPQDGTAPYFELFFDQREISGLALGTRLGKVAPTLFTRGAALPGPGWALFLAAALPVAAVVWAVVAFSAGTIAFALLALLVGLGAYVVLRSVDGIKVVGTDVQDGLAENRFGLVSGRTVRDDIGLTDWLHDVIDRLAGDVRPKGEEGQPLTYGHLARHDIGLVTLTTNLSQAASENFPFSDQTWAFHPADMEALFPEPVFRHLMERGEAATESSHRQVELEEHGLLKLPPADELPILLGARMSLSFPLVISAVPLWRLVPTRDADGDWTVEYQKVWLSDGGICSNIPVHLFDSPLPRRPTYGISLGSGAISLEGLDGDERIAAEQQNVWRPIRTGAGGGAPVGQITGPLGFLGEVLNTMQNWSDNSMTRALGVRDRICTIRLGEGEGGLNLDMSADTVRGLVPRGTAAGKNLAWMLRGEPPAGVDDDKTPALRAQWVRHRWTRLRSSALGLDQHLDDLETGWSSYEVVAQAGPEASAMTYPDLVSEVGTLGYLPYASDWTDTATGHLRRAVDSAIDVPFGDSSTKSPPPFRRLVLSARGEPETDVEG